MSRKGRKNGERIITTCKHCGTQKETSSRARKFCSHQCFTQNRRSTLTKVCLNCGETFAARGPSGKSNPYKVYCDNSCAQQHRPRKRGYKLSSEHRRKISEAQRGPKGHNWQGGIYPEKDAVRRRAEYKEWRRRVFERDDYTCQLCDKRGGQLNADHVKSFANHPELRTKLSNGRTLCVECHKKTPTYAKPARLHE